MEHIEQVVSAWTGVPVERMDQDDKDRLLTLPDVLKVGGWWWTGGPSALLCRAGVLQLPLLLLLSESTQPSGLSLDSLPTSQHQQLTLLPLLPPPSPLPAACSPASSARTTRATPPPAPSCAPAAG